MLQLAAVKTYGARGPKIGATWQIAPMHYALRDGFFQAEYAAKQLGGRPPTNSLRKLLGQR